MDVELIRVYVCADFRVRSTRPTGVPDVHARRHEMRRGIVLGALLTIGALSAAVAAYQQAAAAPKVVAGDKLKDNLFVLKGGGGNTAVFIGSNGVVVVDTKLAGWGQPILSKIKELTPKPVTTIINTHSHGDHVSGNVEFPASVEIVAHEKTKTNVEAWPSVYGLPNAFPNVVKESGGKGVPNKTFKDKMSIGSGSDRIDLFYFGRGHTNGDAWIVFTALRLMHAGDIFSGKNLPLLDANNGGSGVHIGDSLAKAGDSVKNIDTVITGHSTTMTMNDLKEYAQFNRDFLKDVSEAKKAGKSVDEVANTWKIQAK